MTLLFRREAVDHASRRLAGDVILATTIPLQILSGFAILVVVAALIFVSVATYARKETVRGWVTPDQGMIRLTSRQTGVLEAVSVQEGDYVEVGQAIATVRLSESVTQGDAYAIMAENLDAQVAAASAGAQSEVQALDEEAQRLRTQQAALRRELEEADRRVGLQREQLVLADRNMDRAETLVARGVLPTRGLEDIRSTRLVADQRLSEFIAASLSIRRQISETQARLASIPNELDAARARGLATRAALDQQRNLAASQAAAVITATVSGRVTALPLQAGQTVNAGAAVAVITPRGSTLQAELYVPSRASGFVRQNQEVRLLYQAFPYQKFGAGEGRVSSISSTVLAPSELSIPGMRVEEPVFRVRVTLAKDHVSAYGERLLLQPGMLLTADVIIDRRSLIEWLFDPLFAAGRR